MSYFDDLFGGLQRLARNYEGISRAIHEDGLINSAIDRHYAHIVKTEKEDLAKFDDVMERLEKRRHRRPRRHY